jgi:hypothetical protein
VDKRLRKKLGALFVSATHSISPAINSNNTARQFAASFRGNGDTMPLLNECKTRKIL